MKQIKDYSFSTPKEFYRDTFKDLCFYASACVGESGGFPPNATTLGTDANGNIIAGPRFLGGQTPFLGDNTTMVLDVFHGLGAVPSYYSLSTTQPISSNHLSRTITFPTINTMRLTFSSPPLVGENANYVWIVYE